MELQITKSLSLPPTLQAWYQSHFINSSARLNAFTPGPF